MLDRSTSSRREFLAAGAALIGAGVAGAGASAQSAGPVPGPPKALGDAELLDAGLERIHAQYPEARLHRSNHDVL